MLTGRQPDPPRNGSKFRGGDTGKPKNDECPVIREIGSSVRKRLPYSGIASRLPLSLPGRARVAVWTIVNVESWDPASPMPRTVLPAPMGQPLLPDVANWAWHEYGMRVGFWRFLQALGDRGL